MKIFSLFFTMLLLKVSTAQQLPILNSHSSANATVYLDFDGETVQSLLWNYGNTLECAPAGLTAQQITEIFNRVAEDFRPFEINITTDANRFLSAPPDQRMRVIITPNSFIDGVGGVSYTGSFSWGDDTPCFVFCNKLGPNQPKMVAECCSHEVGHTLGLAHQSRYDATCALTASGNGETSWASIMGNSYYRNMSGWNNGPTPQGCNNLQDNLSTITTRNGFGFRTDDYADERGTAYWLTSENPEVRGIIERPGDRDVFRFNISRSSHVQLNAVPFSIGNNQEGAGLDISMKLYNSRQELIREYNPATQLVAGLDTIIETGLYYLEISGTGNNNTSDYSSLGAYTLTGSINAAPPCRVDFSGSVAGNWHELKWSLSCFEQLSAATIQVAADGNEFSDLRTIGIRETRFSYQPMAAGELYYRLKMQSASGNTSFSGVVRLAAPKAVSEIWASTLNTSDITIHAPANFQYRLFDLNGRMVETGQKAAGIQKLSLTNQPAGTYVLWLDACGLRKTVRVLKM